MLFFCGSKNRITYSFFLLAFIQLWDNIKFIKINSWARKFGDKCVDAREKELTHVMSFGNQQILQAAVNSFGVTLAVSNFCGYFIVFKTSIVVSPGWDYFSELKLPKP